MYGQYVVKVAGEAKREERSKEPMSSMEEVFNWYSRTVLPIPVRLSEQCFEKFSEREWRLKEPQGDCEMIVLRLLD